MTNDVNTENVKKEKSVREPLFHIEKRSGMVWWKAWGVRLIAILAALVVCGIFSAITLKANPFEFFMYAIDGAIGTEYRVWLLLFDTALLLGFSVAIVPAFRMKYWNLGANGQVLVGCLATAACMFYFGGKIPNFFLYILMFVSAVAAGCIWAVIPAIFKAFFKTNESLFTLMMNYIAQGLVCFFISIWVTTGSGVLNPMRDYKFPKIYNEHLFTILVVAIMTVLMYIYLRFSKHGYEIAVVGESENTARYVGINVKKVVIRTLLLSGAICGVMGFLLTGAINGTVSENMHDGRGFTAIMVTWLANFNPVFMAVTSCFIIFVNSGVVFASQDYGLTNDAFSDIVIGIIFLFIIGSEFFIKYKVRKSANRKQPKKETAAEAVTEAAAETVTEETTEETATEANVGEENQDNQGNQDNCECDAQTSDREVQE